jgi:hypothetical protein
MTRPAMGPEDSMRSEGPDHLVEPLLKVRGIIA